MDITNDIAVSMAGQITSKVQRIRQLKEEIEARRLSAGIDQGEQEIEALRADLLALTREYHDLTGENWVDGEGYARYRQAGESHKYDTKSVDEGLAAMLALWAELDALADDSEYVATITTADGGQMQAGINAILRGEIATDADMTQAVIGVLASLSDHYTRQAQEISLRLHALDVELKKLAAARRTSTTVETVSVK